MTELPGNNPVNFPFHQRITSTSQPFSRPSQPAGMQTSPSLFTRVLRSPDFPKTGYAILSSSLTRMYLFPAFLGGETIAEDGTCRTKAWLFFAEHVADKGKDNDN